MSKISDYVYSLIDPQLKGLCQVRIKIDGIENQETYCMLSLHHEGPCQKAKVVRDRPSAMPLNEQYYRARKFQMNQASKSVTQITKDVEPKNTCNWK